MNRAKAYATEQSDEQIGLIRISHVDLAAPILLTDAGEDVTVGGDTYLAVPMRFSLPDMFKDSPPAGPMTLDNVSRIAIEAARSVSTPLTLEVTVVWANTPSIVDDGPFEFEVRNVNWTAITMNADLVYEPILGVAVPSDSFNPAFFPGLFR